MGKKRPSQWIAGEACNGHDAPARRRGAVRRMHVVSAALVAITVVVAITAGAARAAIGVTVGEPTLSADRNSITVPVSVSCSPFDPSLTTFSLRWSP